MTIVNAAYQPNPPLCICFMRFYDFGTSAVVTSKNMLNVRPLTIYIYRPNTMHVMAQQIRVEDLYQPFQWILREVSGHMKTTYGRTCEFQCTSRRYRAVDYEETASIALVPGGLRCPKYPSATKLTLLFLTVSDYTSFRMVLYTEVPGAVNVVKDFTLESTENSSNIDALQAKLKDLFYNGQQYIDSIQQRDTNERVKKESLESESRLLTEFEQLARRHLTQSIQAICLEFSSTANFDKLNDTQKRWLLIKTFSDVVNSKFPLPRLEAFAMILERLKQI